MLKIRMRQDDFIDLEASGRLTQEDYNYVLPQMEDLFAHHSSVRAVLRVSDIESFSAKAFVQGLKFDVRHRKNYSKIAVLGDSRLHKWLTKAAVPFYRGEVRYFDEDSAERDAMIWLNAPPDPVDLASENSFPASDPPSMTPPH